MFRLPFFAIVALGIAFSSCKNKTETKSESPKLGQWDEVYKMANKNGDYSTSIVALNQLIVRDTANWPAYYDSLAHYYIKKEKNYDAGMKIVRKGLEVSPNNFNFLEYNSIFLNAENKQDEARKALQKAYELSGKKKHLYMYATTFADGDNMEEYFNIINSFLYDPSFKSEMVQVPIDEYNFQEVELKALCYLDKAKLSKSPKLIVNYVDTALMISPDYQEALYIKKNLNKK